jgi:glutathione synthase/RimK-type ligase-like ATP-grasp enzyme
MGVRIADVSEGVAELDQKRVLIVTDPSDVHAEAVAYALRTKGHHCECLLAPDFPTLLSLSTRIDPGDRAGRFRLRGPGVLQEDQSRPFDAIWMRRPGGAVLPEDMHPGDRVIAARQCEVFLSSVTAFLNHGAGTFWVNPPASDAMAPYKPFQLRSAVRAGLTIPATLISNDPDDIRSFLREHGGVVAHKLLRPAAWVADGAGGDDGEHVYAAYTVPVTEAQLPDDDVLRLCPGIFQEFLQKSFEVRVACLGDFLVAARINSQADERAATDWREGQMHIGMEPYELPHGVAEGCRRLLRQLGVVHASLDFVVAPNGDHIFLESNAQGQFLFLEDRAGLPLLDMFSEFLVRGTMDFTWRGDDHEAVRFEDFATVWTQTWRTEAARHVQFQKPWGAPDAP